MCEDLDRQPVQVSSSTSCISLSRIVIVISHRAAQTLLQQRQPSLALNYTCLRPVHCVGSIEDSDSNTHSSSLARGVVLGIAITLILGRLYSLLLDAAWCADRLVALCSACALACYQWRQGNCSRRACREGFACVVRLLEAGVLTSSSACVLTADTVAGPLRPPTTIITQVPCSPWRCTRMHTMRVCTCASASL